MDDRNRLRLEALIRIKKFMDTNAADFAGGAAAAQRTALNNAVANTQTKGSEQQSGFGKAASAFEQKDTARENLRDDLSDISNMARAMEYEFDGMAAKYHFERNMADQAMIAFANAVHTNSAADNANFITYGLPTTFRADLQTAIDDFVAAVADAAGFVEEHVEATEDFGQGVRAGMIAKRILDAIAKQKYASDPGKLAAWFSASHVEKSAKKTPTP